MAGAKKRLDILAAEMNMAHAGADGDAEFFTHR
jgi:hypothetical protein